MQDWLWMTATDLGRQIAGGQIDPVDLTETFLQAIDQHPLRDRIYARVTADRARDEAAAASARAQSGLRRSLLDGVAVSWKDLFDTAGVPTEAGTQLLAGRTPDTDATVLQNATAAGLVCLGKTHMSEIAFSGLGLNPMTATPPCKNDQDAVAGGSSSGAAASVAFGLAAAGIGSDTGGSVRIPSAWNDLVGFKPAQGRLSVSGVVPLCKSFDTVGPLCRSVQDASMISAILGGENVADLAGANLKGSRFLILETIAMDDLQEYPKQAFEATVQQLETSGCTIARGRFDLLNEAFDLAGTLYAAESYGWWHDKVEAAPEKMFPQILERVRAGRTISGPDYVAAWTKLHDIRAAFAKVITGYDAVIMPTAPIMPPDAEKLLTDDAYYKAQNLLALRNTRIGNLMDLTSLTLPTGTPSCGIMLNTLKSDEARLLRLGAAIEAVLRGQS